MRPELLTIMLNISLVAFQLFSGLVLTVMSREFKTNPKNVYSRLGMRIDFSLRNELDRKGNVM